MNETTQTGDRNLQITGRTTDGTALHGVVTRWVSDRVSFDVSSPNCVLRSSELIEEFKVWNCGQAVWSGTAVVQAVVDLGVGYACEATFDKGALLSMRKGLTVFGDCENQIRILIREGLHHLSNKLIVPEEFKILAVDFMLLFASVRTELDRVESVFEGMEAKEREGAELKLIRGILDAFGSRANDVVERFENIVDTFSDEQKVHCRQMFRALLHPMVLSAPFAHRSFTKPLGYAGDYEMVCMILRNKFEGRSLFAKFLNGWFLSQAPARAHRNRVTLLLRHIQNEVVRGIGVRNCTRIYSLGCGPAGEVQQFMTSGKTGGQVKFTLVDFNVETIDYVSANLIASSSMRRPDCTVEVVKKSVNQLLQEALRSARSNDKSPQYEFVYCAGLFDYLTDAVCRRLIELLYERVAPDGLLVVTNVDQSHNSHRCFRNSLDFFLDWNLIYRTASQLASIIPVSIPKEQCRVYSEDSGVNVFLEIRKPAN